jgi:SOS response regulatory protein OraA/RecX
MEVIDQALADQPQDDIAAIKQLIAKRGHRYPDRQKLMAFLARQGFQYGDIKTALTEE